MLEMLMLKKAECEDDVAVCEAELKRAMLRLELVQELIEEATEETEETNAQPC